MAFVRCYEKQSAEYIYMYVYVYVFMFIIAYILNAFQTSLCGL